jgi:hypothetical protein
MLQRLGILLRVEGALALTLSIILYRQTNFGWGIFALLFLAPDLSMLGYLVNARAGAAAYNFVHTYSLPLILFAYAIIAGKPVLLPYGLVWTAHIGMDRLLGFGLKYPTQFRDTHLQRV